MIWNAVFDFTIYCAFAYLIFTAFLVIGIIRLPRGSAEGLPFISVVIAARNEENNIRDCLNAVMVQDYPADRYEVIIVDDRSTDGTADVVRRMAASHPNVRLLHISNPHPHIAPKKYALQQGIEHSKGEIIITTDADCRPGYAWIKRLTSYFTPDVGLVAGFSPLVIEDSNTSFFGSFLSIDALGLAVLAGGGIGMNWGTTCTGRNLAYRKTVYDEIGGFDSFAAYVSGDDDLLLHAVRRMTSWRIAYAAHPEANVPSIVNPSLKSIAHQRIRHASKFKAYPWDIRILGAGLYFFNLLLVCSLIGFILNSGQVVSPLYAYGLKFLADIIVLTAGILSFGTRIPLTFVPVVSCIHPFYVVVFGMWGLLGKFRWKDTAFRSETLV